MTEPTQTIPRWNGKPITPGWWWLQFTDGLGPRHWDGTFWDRGSIFVGAEDYADYPVVGPCVPPDSLVEQSEAIIEGMDYRPTVSRQCGTCRWWTGGDPIQEAMQVDASAPLMKQCTWPHPPIPFWASISEGNDHADWTQAADGRRCETWCLTDE